MHGVIQQSDAAAGDAAENFHDDKAERGDHSPTEHSGTQHRMRVTRMTVIVTVQMAAHLRALVVARHPFMKLAAHRYHSTCSVNAAQPSAALIRQFDTPPPRIH
jgi:hypothetical protein